MSESSRLDTWERRTEWPLATAAVIFLAAYSAQVLVQPGPVITDVVEFGLTATWIVFGVDYTIRFMIAPQKLRWFFRHLLDLAAVVLPMLRPLQMLRLLVVFTALQKALGGATRGRVVIYTVTSAVVLIYSASLAVLDAERSSPDASIRSFGEALWWAITTVTTVGYGDYSPVTGAGRLIAFLLMLGGISLIGVVTATLASWIVDRVADEDAENQAATVKQMHELQREMQELRKEILDNRRALLQRDIT